MTVLRPRPVPTKQLSWEPVLNQWVGEISCTHGFGQVYDDACDVGLTLVGKTGVEVPFVVEHTERRPDGEIMWWRLQPADQRDRQRHPGVTVLLFND